MPKEAKPVSMPATNKQTNKQMAHQRCTQAAAPAQGRTELLRTGQLRLHTDCQKLCPQEREGVAVIIGEDSGGQTREAPSCKAVDAADGGDGAAARRRGCGGWGC